MPAATVTATSVKTWKSLCSLSVLGHCRNSCCVSVQRLHRSEEHLKANHITTQCKDWPSLKAPPDAPSSPCFGDIAWRRLSLSWVKHLVTQPGNAPKARPPHLTTADQVNKDSEGLAFKDSKGRVLQRRPTLNWDTEILLQLNLQEARQAMKPVSLVAKRCSYNVMWCTRAKRLSPVSLHCKRGTCKRLDTFIWASQTPKWPAAICSTKIWKVLKSCMF